MTLKIIESSRIPVLRVLSPGETPSGRDDTTAAETRFVQMRLSSQLAFLQDILPILWTKGPGQMLTAT